MRLWRRLFQRFYASSRPASVSKGIKSEMNFKEGNAISSPYDVIDRNVPGIEKRLSLLEMRRLKEQLELDQVDLDSLKKMNSPISNAESAVRNSELDGMEVSYNVLSNFPGLNHPTESSSDSSVTFRIPLESLSISESEKTKLMNILKIDASSKDLEFKISNFPLVSQNKSRAIEVFNALINFVKSNNELDHGEFNVSALLSDPKSAKSEKRKPDRLKIIPEFPTEWLLNLEKGQKTE